MEMTFAKGARGFLLGALCAAALGLGLVPGTPARAADSVPLGKSQIVYAHATWGSSRVLYALGKVLLEKIGYTVQDKVLDTGIIYASLAADQVDLFSSSWLPGQQPYLNKYGNKLDLISFSIVPVPGGLMVPSYVPVNSIEDLKKSDVAKLFDNKIFGIDAGSGINLSTKKVIQQYGLSLQLIPSSDAAMTSEFKSAYEQHKPIVVTGWCPHILCALYGVKFLQDPKKIYGEDRDLNVARAGFRTDFPRATVFLSRFTLTDKQISQLLVWVDTQHMTDTQAVDRFITENPALVWYMIGGLAPTVSKPTDLD
jgi:glycine betaine/proline transport system substrate-binding protein